MCILQVLKWNFASPRSEHVVQLKEQLQPCLSPDLFAQMCHDDFKQHLKALETLIKVGTIVVHSSTYFSGDYTLINSLSPSLPLSLSLSLPGCIRPSPSSQGSRHRFSWPPPTLDNTSILRHQHDGQHEMPRIPSNSVSNAHQRGRFQNERLWGPGLSSLSCYKGTHNICTIEVYWLMYRNSEPNILFFVIFDYGLWN